MTTRKPLVVVAGALTELPAGDDIATTGTPGDIVGRLVATDTIDIRSGAEGLVKEDLATIMLGYDLETISQIVGATVANIMEVEANTRAVRVIYRPFDGQGLQEQGFEVSRHALGVNAQCNATTTFAADTEIITAGWFGPGVALLRKVSASAATSAISGVRVGTCRVELIEYNPMIELGATNFWMTPAIGSSPTGTGPNIQSMKTRQAPPLLQVQFLGNGVAPAVSTAIGVRNLTRPLASIIGACKSAIESNIKPTVMFDVDAGSMPFIMAPGTGFGTTCVFPAAGTSQTVRLTTSIVWDEWVPITTF